MRRLARYTLNVVAVLALLTCVESEAVSGHSQADPLALMALGQTTRMSPPEDSARELARLLEERRRAGDESIRSVVWLIAVTWALILIPMAVWFAKFLAGRRRKRIDKEMLARGRCPRCDYDLRATPDRCPECGAGKGAG